MGDGVVLQPLNALNWQAALEVRVTDEQLPHVADHQPIALVILAKAQVGHGGGVWEPMGIVVDDQVVGVMGLTHRGDTSFMENLAIDHRRQGEGIGRAAVVLALKHCAALGSAQMLLTVSDDNHSAQRIYLSVGFQFTGDRPFGDPEMRCPLPQV